VGAAPKAGGGDRAGAATEPNTDPELKTLAEVASVVAGAKPKAPREAAVVVTAPNGAETAVALVATAPNMPDAVVAVAAELNGAAEVAVVVSVELPNRELEMPKRPAEGVSLVSDVVMGVIVRPEGVLRRAGAGLVAAAAAGRVTNEKLEVAEGVALKGAGVDAVVVVGVVTAGVVAGGVDAGVLGGAVEAGAEPKMETPLLVEDPNEKAVAPVDGVVTAPKANLGVVLEAAVEVGVANRVDPEKRLGLDEAVEKKLLLVSGVARGDEERGTALGVADGVGEAGLACRIEARIGDDSLSTRIRKQVRV
jgi:hypothetical protein